VSVIGVRSASVQKRTASWRSGSLGSGAITALAQTVQTGLAAVVGIVLAREFGRSAKTDGFFAAYAVYIVVLLAANAIRVAVMPPLARARGERRLGSELAAYALTLAVMGLPLLVLALAAGGPCAWLLTGNGPAAARQTAADALGWMIAASILQLYAGLAASTLAALDDYVVAACGYALGSVVGLAYILLRVDSAGIQAVAQGMALNGLIACVLPATALALRARAEGAPARAVRPDRLSFTARVAELGRGVALPLAMQALYLICLPLAAHEGVGAQTTFGYAYLIASAVVAVTGSSLSLVTAVPLTRSGIDAVRSARHVVSSSWLALVALGATAGVFGLAGGSIVHAVLGSGYRANVGSELGRVVVVLSLWALASVAFSVTFPLMFVVRRTGRLPLLALLAVALQVPVAVLGRYAAGLYGLALALALTTALVLIALLRELGALRPTSRELGLAALTVAALTGVCFAPASLLPGSLAAAAAGLVLYALLLVLVRPPGLLAAWRYLHQLA
jgi:O-antigen/teichoic acid export membrane protein